MPKLTVYQSDGSPVKYGLNGKSFTVGRAETNDIVLPGGSASNHHAVLKASDSGDFVVTDFDSTNHTLVNGEMVTVRTLKDGDEVHFGDILALYTSEVSGESQPHRAAPKIQSERPTIEPEPIAEPAPTVRKNPAPRPGAQRGPANQGGLAPAAPSSGGGCFAMLLMLFVAGAAFVVGLMIRHSRDHSGQSLPQYVAEWRLEQQKAAQAAE